ncbi:zinc finger domain-containing protein [Nocardia aurea]
MTSEWSRHCLAVACPACNARVGQQCQPPASRGTVVHWARRVAELAAVGVAAGGSSRDIR